MINIEEDQEVGMVIISTTATEMIIGMIKKKGVENAVTKGGITEIKSELIIHKKHVSK